MLQQKKKIRRNMDVARCCNAKRISQREESKHLLNAQWFMVNGNAVVLMVARIFFLLRSFGTNLLIFVSLKIHIAMDGAPHPGEKGDPPSEVLQPPCVRWGGRGLSHLIKQRTDCRRPGRKLAFAFVA